VLERKYEGLIIKGCSDPYFTNESRSHWKKLKRGFASSRDARISKIELDLVVMGANRGQGSRNSKAFTSYLLGTVFNGKIIPLSNVGSGLTEEMIGLITQHVSDHCLRADHVPEEYELGGAKADVYFKPALVFEVHAQELTVSPLYKLGAGEFGGLSLRFPVFKGIRTDKGVKEATTGQ
jgi:DNA ligase 1